LASEHEAGQSAIGDKATTPGALRRHYDPSGPRIAQRPQVTALIRDPSTLTTKHPNLTIVNSEERSRQRRTREDSLKRPADLEILFNDRGRTQTRAGRRFAENGVTLRSRQ
jgi:hypothetical protein